MTKVIIHTKTGKKLVYYSNTEPEAGEVWEDILNTEKNHNSCIRFGRYVTRLDNIDFVEVRY